MGNINVTGKSVGELLASAVLSDAIVAAVVPRVHQIDFSKIETWEDMKKVMEANSLYVRDDNPLFEQLKPFIKQD